VNEIRRLLSKLAHAVRHEAEHVLHWSRWLRRHQHRARLSHYRRRVTDPRNCGLQYEPEKRLTPAGVRRSDGAS
jgi:hypothetical protein